MWRSATGKSGLPRTDGCGAGRTFRSSRCIIWRCWNAGTARRVVAGAIDHARPLENWDLPDCFAIVRRRLEDERGGEGTREFIRVLRLLEKHSLPDLTRAVTKGLRSGMLIRDAIAQLLIPQEEWRQTTFRLDGREHLRQVKVAQTNVAGYRELLTVGGVQ